MKDLARRLIAMGIAVACQAAHAAPVTIQVDYEPAVLQQVECGGGTPSGSCSLPATSSDQLVSLIFDIEDSVRAVDGSYDVASGLRGSFLDGFQPFVDAAGGSITLLTASAITQGGLVTDLLLGFGFSFVQEGTRVDHSYSGVAGGYSASIRIDYPPPFSDDAWVRYDYLGTYSISQAPSDLQPGPGSTNPVPEPGTWLLLAAGLLLMPMARGLSHRPSRSGSRHDNGSE